MNKKCVFFSVLWEALHSTFIHRAAALGCKLSPRSRCSVLPTAIVIVMPVWYDNDYRSWQDSTVDLGPGHDKDDKNWHDNTNRSRKRLLFNMTTTIEVTKTRQHKLIWGQASRQGCLWTWRLPRHDSTNGHRTRPLSAGSSWSGAKNLSVWRSRSSETQSGL